MIYSVACVLNWKLMEHHIILDVVWLKELSPVNLLLLLWQLSLQVWRNPLNLFRGAEYLRFQVQPPWQLIKKLWLQHFGAKSLKVIIIGSHKERTSHILRHESLCTGKTFFVKTILGWVEGEGDFHGNFSIFRIIKLSSRVKQMLVGWPKWYRIGKEENTNFQGNRNTR